MWCGGYTTRWGDVRCNVWCVVRCSVWYSVVRPTMSEGGGYARERGGGVKRRGVKKTNSERCGNTSSGVLNNVPVCTPS